MRRLCGLQLALALRWCHAGRRGAGAPCVRRHCLPPPLPAHVFQRARSAQWGSQRLGGPVRTNDTAAAHTHTHTHTQLFSTMGKATKTESSRKTQAEKAGLTLPVARIGSQLKKGRYGKRVSATAAVLLTSVLEYATSELLSLSGNAAGEKHNIKPRHVMLAVREDDDLSKLLSNVTIAGGGVAGGVHGALEKKKKKAAAEGKKSKGKSSKKSKKSSKSPKKSPKKSE
eukprot:TRINITY_DN50_c0_g1_i12.p4 TRINITY_DN50_c0_g1~~TRINITY_DN50_c0_g1_i12.p4  ORF type:complete len:228 (+),score=91.28 TRINITY_DN50_c0_g1_i12:854-1537(+)